MPGDIGILLEKTKKVYCMIGDDTTNSFNDFIMYVIHEPQCLLAARDGFDAESPSVMLTQLHRLEACLAEGAIPNATLVRKDNR